MGWLFGWQTRKELVEHLLNGNGVKTLRHCSVGNNMWAVQEYANQRDGSTVRFVCLYLIKGPPFGREDRHGWGYKDVDETMGPCETSCPASYLDLAQPEPTEGYAVEWRKLVRARAAKLKAAIAGARFKRADGEVFEIKKRRSPTSWYVEQLSQGVRYRCGSQFINSMEVEQ